MSRAAVARNYAGTLLELAVREGDVGGYGERLAEMAAMLREEPDFRRFVETPRISLADKRSALREALGDRYPSTFLRFLLVTLDKRRLPLLPEMETAYQELVDERSGRARAAVTLAIEADPGLRETIRAALERALRSEVVASFRRDPGIIGGLVVRVGDRLLDASLRRRLKELRRALIEEGAPAG